MNPLFRVVKSGVYATIQDRGRFGYRKFGMPTAGPMDQQAFSLGQNIMGNKDRNQNALEIFLGGLTLEVLENHRIIITGADLGAVIDGTSKAPMWKTFTVLKGQTIAFTKPSNGTIAYLISEGGFCAQEVMGSSATYQRGLIGKVIEPKTILHANSLMEKSMNRGLRIKEIPIYTENITVELFPSPHLKLFKKSSIETFLTSTYTYQSGDRMGYFLKGPPLEFSSSGDIVSESTQFGTIQVPSNGQPIILMADAQTIGGYATIGTAVKEDLPKIAQLRTGGKIRFSYREII